MKGIVEEFSRVSNCCRGFTRNKSLLGFRRNCCRVLKNFAGFKKKLLQRLKLLLQGFAGAKTGEGGTPVGGREHGQRGGVRSVYHHHHQRRHHHHHLGGVESVLARFISVIVIVDIFVYSRFLYFCKINILCFSSFSTFSWISTQTIKSHVYFYTLGGFPFIILLFHEVPESFLN